MAVSRRTILPSPARSSLFNTTPPCYLAAARDRIAMSDLAGWAAWASGRGSSWKGWGDGQGMGLEGWVLPPGRLTRRPWQPADAVSVQAILADERIHRCLPMP